MSRHREDVVDLTTVSRATDPESSPAPANPRPFLRVYFSCARLYTRVYRQADGDCYLARCGKCGKTMRFTVGEGGTSDRSFTLSCGGAAP